MGATLHLNDGTNTHLTVGQTMITAGLVIPSAILLNFCAWLNLWTLGASLVVGLSLGRYFYPPARKSTPRHLDDEFNSADDSLLGFPEPLSRREQTGTTGANAASVAPAAAHRAHLDAQVKSIIEEYAQYELDPALAIDFPAMNDPREEPTSHFLKSLRAATLAASADSVDYEAAVDNLLAAFADAERHAAHVGLSHYSPALRRELTLAKTLLHLARDAGASENERRLASRKLLRTLTATPGMKAGTLRAIETLSKQQLTSKPASTDQ